MNAPETPPIVLASASPRRLALLRSIGLDALVLAADIDESPEPAEAPADLTLRLARAKARHIAGRLRASAGRSGVTAYTDAVVLAADTVVVAGERVFGKPADRDDALAMLAALSGREHEVLTAVAVVRGEVAAEALSTTRVWFRVIDRTEAEAYWASGEPRDKAGAYGIQGIGGIFATRIDGSYSGVMGLPVAETDALLAQVGVATWARRTTHG